MAAAQNDGPVPGNLFANGSFEQPPTFSGWNVSHIYVFPTWMRQYDLFENPFPQNYDYVEPGIHYGMTFNAADGNTAVNVIGMSLYQFAALVPGQQYRLTFSLGSFDDGHHDVRGWGASDVTIFQGANLAQNLAPLIAGGTTIPASVSANWQRFLNETPGLYQVGWVEQSYTFQATASEAAFFFQGGGFSFSYYTGLDNVALVLVPEPSVLTLSVAGALMGLIAWRRRKAKT